MVTLRTKTAFELLDERQNSIGLFIIYLKAEELIMNNGLVTLNGFYYYIKDTLIDVELGTIHSETIILSKFSQKFLWEQIQNIETILQPINTVNLKQAVKQRIREFTFLQLQLEAGENFSTSETDWEVL